MFVLNIKWTDFIYKKYNAFIKSDINSSNLHGF